METQPHQERKTFPLETFKRFALTGDPALREELILSHLWLVKILAAKYRHSGAPQESLISVGTIGLIKALGHFNPELAVQFTTYATSTILGEIKRYFRDKCWRVSVPRHSKELYLKARKVMDALAQASGKPPTAAQIAQQVGCSEEEILEVIDAGGAFRPLSLQMKMHPDAADDDTSTLEDCLGATDAQRDHRCLQLDIETALGMLDERSRDAIRICYLGGMSQEVVAKHLGISQGHVSRLLAEGLAKMKHILEGNTDGSERVA